MSNSWTKTYNPIQSFINTLISFTIFAVIFNSIKSFVDNATHYIKVIQSLANAVKSYTLRYAYYLFALRTLSATGVSMQYNRSGITAAKLVIELAVAFLLFNILFPIAMNQAVTASTGAWNSAVALVFGVVVPILVAIAAVEHFLPF